MKSLHRIPIIIIYVIAFYFSGMNYSLAADSDDGKVDIVKTSIIYTYGGDKNKKEVGGPKAACELVIKDECSINDCSDRNWKVDGEPEINGTYVNCKYTGDNGLVWGSSPAVVEVVCPENAEPSWDGDEPYCSCLSDFVERGDKCVATEDETDDDLQTTEVPPAKPIGPPSDITKPKGETTAESDARHRAEVEQFNRNKANSIVENEEQDRAASGTKIVVHHVVPQDDARAREARDNMVANGIDPRIEKTNLVRIPENKHYITFRESYVTMTNDRIAAQDGADAIKAECLKIANELTTKTVEELANIYPSK